MKTNWKSWLFESVSSQSLAVYRILFGSLLAIGTLRFAYMGWIERSFIEPIFFFKYWGFEWVPSLSPVGIYSLFVLLFLSSLFIALGLFTRISCWIFFFVFSWVELIDASNYLNHYYLVSILGFLNLFLPLGHRWSLDVLFGRVQKMEWIPAWNVYLLRTQFSVVYFYAGLAKLTSDWLLHAQPMNLWMTANIDIPVVGFIFGQSWAHYGAAWAGFLYDLLIWIFLWNSRTRLYAYGVVLCFHTMTHLMFPIGMFPFIMTLGTLIFFSPDWPSRVVRFLGLKSLKVSRPQVPTQGEFSWKVAAMGAFVIFQMVFPLRWLFYPNHVLWSEEGGRWSWKVMAREKNGDVEFRVVDQKTQESFVVYPQKYLARHQELEMSGQPDLILQLAHKIGEDFMKEGRQVSVYADAWVSLNGRVAQQWIDPHIDLLTVKDTWSSKSWVMPAPTENPPLQRAAR